MTETPEQNRIQALIDRVEKLPTELTKPILDDIAALRRETVSTTPSVDISNKLTILESRLNAAEQHSLDTKKVEIQEIFKDLAPERIESSLLSTEKILKMCPEKQKVLLHGYAGSLILETFEKGGQQIVLKSNNEIEINPIDQDHSTPELLQNNINLRLKLQTLLKNGALNLDMLKIGMLYRAKSFVNYSNGVRSEEGVVMNPEEVKNPNKYFEYLQNLQKTGYKLSPAEETLMASREGFAGFNTMLPAIKQVKDLGQIQKISEAMNGVSSGTREKSTTGAVGEGIGKIAATAGKIAAAGTNGGIKVLGEILASATKEGGELGALAVLGGLIAAIWKFGFWKTIGGVFGLGVISEASAGNLDLGFGSKEENGEKSSKKSKLSHEKSEVFQSEQISQMKTEIQQDMNVKNMEQSKFDAIFDSISTSLDFNNQPILTLEQAIAGGSTGSLELFFGNIEHVGNMTGKEFYEKYGKEDIQKILQAFLVKKESADIKFSDLLIKTSSVVVPVESSQTIDTLAGNKTIPTTPEQMTQEAESLEIQGYSSLYILTRAVELGFIPKTHDRAFKDTVNSSKTQTWNWIKHKGAYIIDGGPFTNGTFDSTSKANNWFNEQIGKVLKADVLLEKAEIQSLLSLPSKLSLADTYNLKERMKVLNELDVALSLGGDKTKIQELLFDYKALSGENLKSILQKYNVKTYTDAIGMEKESIGYQAQQIEQMNNKVLLLKEEAKTKLAEFNKLAEKDPTKVEFYKKEGERIIQEINEKITILETSGVKNLQKLDPDAIKKLAQQSPWVEKLAKANGGMDTFVKKLTETKFGKIAIGTALLAIVSSSGDAWADIWDKGISGENMKTAGDLVIGFIPVAGGVHDLMVANADWYKNFWLGDRELSTEELVARDAFGAIGLIPGAGTLVKVVGKGSAKVINGATIAMEGAKLTGKVGTYGYLGYSLEEVVRDTAIYLYDRT